MPLGQQEKPRCPTCLSNNPWFTRCQDASALTPEQRARHDRVRHRRGCADPWHEDIDAMRESIAEGLRRG